MAQEVFISHAEEDSAIALTLAAALESQGFATWYYERDAVPGSSYLLQVGEAIDACSAFVLLISKDSLSSWQMTSEVGRAHESHKPFFPILVDVSHSEFQTRQPEWRMAVGMAASVNLATLGGQGVAAAVARGLERQHILRAQSPPRKAAVAQAPAQAPAVTHAPATTAPPLTARMIPGPTPPARANLGDSWIHPKTGMEMVYIPAGEFLMGDDDKPNNPRRTVTLSAYWISRTVVSVEQYLAFCDETGYTRAEPPEFNPNWSKLDHPIVNVRWDDAQAYCTWAGFALPTEAQWEKAARGTDGRKYPWGDTFDGSKLQCSVGGRNGSGTAPVRRYRQGPYDLCDMAGNVWQWCRDWYDADFWKGRPAGDEDPANAAEGTRRVLRGGSWDWNNTVFFRAAFRFFPSNWNYNWGFRVVLQG